MCPLSKTAVTRAKASSGRPRLRARGRRARAAAADTGWQLTTRLAESDRLGGPPAARGDSRPRTPSTCASRREVLPPRDPPDPSRARGPAPRSADDSAAANRAGGELPGGASREDRGQDVHERPRRPRQAFGTGRQQRRLERGRRCMRQPTRRAAASAARTSRRPARALSSERCERGGGIEIVGRERREAAGHCERPTARPACRHGSPRRARGAPGVDPTPVPGAHASIAGTMAAFRAGGRSGVAPAVQCLHGPLERFGGGSLGEMHGHPRLSPAPRGSAHAGSVTAPMRSTIASARSPSPAMAAASGGTDEPQRACVGLARQLGPLARTPQRPRRDRPVNAPDPRCARARRPPCRPYRGPPRRDATPGGRRHPPRSRTSASGHGARAPRRRTARRR